MKKVKNSKVTIILFFLCISVSLLCCDVSIIGTSKFASFMGDEKKFIIEKTIDELTHDNVLREIAVTINTHALSKSQSSLIELDLFKDVSCKAILELPVYNKKNSIYTWTGRLEGDEYSQVIITSKNDSVYANIQTSHGRIYEVRKKNGIPVAIEKKQTTDGECGNDIHVTDLKGVEKNKTFTKKKITIDEIFIDDIFLLNPIIQVLVLYTEDVFDIYGSVTDVELFIAAIEADVNLGYDNSNVRQRINIVHNQQVDFQEGVYSDGSIPCAFLPIHSGCVIPSALHYMSNSFAIKSLRNTHKADMVAMLVKPQGGALRGQARGIPVTKTMLRKGEFLGYYLADDGSVYSEVHVDEPFVSVWSAFAIDQHIFAHELGHLQGARHDLAADPSPDSEILYPYGHGFCGSDPFMIGIVNYKTIMSYVSCFNYDEEPHYDRFLNYWSDPDLTWIFYTLGSVDDEDNVRLLNATGSYAAQWR